MLVLLTSHSISKQFWKLGKDKLGAWIKRSLSCLKTLYFSSTPFKSNIFFNNFIKKRSNDIKALFGLEVVSEWKVEGVEEWKCEESVEKFESVWIWRC